MTEDSGDVVPLRGSPLAEQHLEKLRAAHAAGLKVIDAPHAPPAPPVWRRCPELVDEILAKANDPWVSLRLGPDELVSLRAGEMVSVAGPTGAGKSSLVATMIIEHAQRAGPVIVLSRELPADELAARIVGIQCDASWSDVLRGKVDRADMTRALDMDRMFLLERKNASLDALVAALKMVSVEYPGQPALVVVDYLQIIESSERDARAKVADVVARIDDLTREHGAVTICVTQMSRSAARSARSGEAIGAETTDGGAESAAIERTMSVTLTIGSSGPPREDGTCAVDLNLGKYRKEGGDRVVPASYCGRSGRWRVTGNSRSASEVKAERQGERENSRQTAAELAILAAADRAGEPKPREELSAVAACSMGIRRAAIAALLSRGDLVEVQRKKPRARPWMVWTRAKAEEAGIPIVRFGEGDS